MKTAFLTVVAGVLFSYFIFCIALFTGSFLNFNLFVADFLLFILINLTMVERRQE